MLKPFFLSPFWSPPGPEKNTRLVRGRGFWECVELQASRKRDPEPDESSLTLRRGKLKVCVLPRARSPPASRASPSAISNLPRQDARGLLVASKLPTRKQTAATARVPKRRSADDLPRVSTARFPARLIHRLTSRNKRSPSCACALAPRRVTHRISLEVLTHLDLCVEKPNSSILGGKSAIVLNVCTCTTTCADRNIYIYIYRVKNMTSGFPIIFPACVCVCFFFPSMLSGSNYMSWNHRGHSQIPPT